MKTNKKVPVYAKVDLATKKKIEKYLGTTGQKQERFIEQAITEFLGRFFGANK